MPGYERTREDLDRRAGSLARRLSQIVTEAQLFQDTINDINGADGEGLKDMYGSQEDADIVKNFANDFVNIARIIRGEEHDAGMELPRDFTFFARQLWGIW